MELIQASFNGMCAIDEDDTSLILDSRCQRGWTLIELIVVIGLVAFLSRLAINQLSVGLEEKNLDATVSNLGVYFSNASRMARASGKWVLVVVNTNPDSTGFLRQFGTYQWFKGEEPGGDTSFVDINGNGKRDESSGAGKLIEGWNVEDSKGYWLPDKIFFDLLRSGPAQFDKDSSEFQTFERYSSGEKFLQFAMKHKNTSGAGDDPVTAIDRGRLPFFLDRSGQESGLRNGENQILSNNADNTGNTDSLVDFFLAREISFSKSSKDWVFFAFDPYGQYVNLKNGIILGSGAPAQAQQDFIVLSQGYMDPDEMHKIRGKNDDQPAPSAAFLIHRSGSFTVSQDDFQIPKTTQ